MTNFFVLKAEVRKLSGSVAGYLIPLTVLILLVMLYLIFSLDPNRIAKLGVDPWPVYFRTVQTLYAMLIISLLSVLLVASVLYTEERADAWKQLYVLPVGRGRLYLLRLLLLIGMVGLTTLCYGLFAWGLGVLLGGLYPEYELGFYAPDLRGFSGGMLRIFVSVLGITSLQHTLGLALKRPIVALGIGFLGIVAGFILSTTEADITRYFPYAFPIIAHDYGAAAEVHRGEVVVGLNAGELGSLVCFVVCTVLGYLLNRGNRLQRIKDVLGGNAGTVVTAEVP